MNNSENINEEIAEEIIESGGEVAGKGMRKILNKAKKGARKALLKIGKTMMNALLLTLKAAAPVILGVLILLGFIHFSYYVIHEFTGTEKEYVKKYENKITKSDSGVYITTESLMVPDNKAVRDYYIYFSGQSFWKLIHQDNETLYSPDEKPEVKDEYGREEMFKLPPHLLYSLDDFMYNWEWKYSEQFIKPLNYDKDNLTLIQLTDEDGIVNVESDEEDIETGEKTGNKITSIRDYGLASILKYNEKDDYKEITKIKGEYIGEDVWNPETKQVEKVIFDSPVPFEDVIVKEKDIWLIDKAILFTGEIEYEYEYQETWYDNLRTGVGESEKSTTTEYIYETGYDPNCQIVQKTDNITGEEYEEKICGEPIYYELKRYRSNDSAIFKEKPVEVKVVTEDKGQDYFLDYLYNFETYVPIDVIDEFDLKDRIDYDSYIFDYQAILEDDFGFDLGNASGADAYLQAAQYFEIIEMYSAEFGVDPYIILAIIAQESGGNPNINEDGLAQITDSAGKTIISTNVWGETIAHTVEKHERTDPDKSIQYLVMKFKNLLELMDGDPYKAIQAYNFGTGTMETLKNLNPEAWETNGWLVYREAARRHHAPAGKASASYRCMAFPEGTLPSVKGNLWGDSCYLENVLRFYTGHEIERVDTGGNSIFDRLSSVAKTMSDAFKQFFRLGKDSKEPIPKIDFKNHVVENRITDVLTTTKALDNQQLFSEAGVNEFTEMNFWDKGFMGAIGNSGLSLDEILEFVPNKDGYYPPILFEPGMRISSPYGPRWGRMHHGVDIAAPTGTPVYATAGGKVVYAGWQNPNDKSEGAGLYVKIDHGDGVESLYMHLSKIFVSKGDIVNRGDNIGEVGNTGGSQGSHLHFEMRKNGISFDTRAIVDTGDSSTSD